MAFAKISSKYYSNKNSSGKVALKLRLTINGKRHELYPRIALELEQWDQDRQKVIGTTEKYQLNDELDKFKRVCREVETKLREEIGEYSKTQLKSAIKTVWIGGEKTTQRGTPKRFWDFYDYFIEYKRSTGHNEKHTVGFYINLRERLKQFNSTLEWADLNEPFIHDFTKHIEDERGASLAYIGKYTKNLITVINQAKKERIEAALKVQTSDWQKFNEKKITPTLSLEELEALYNLDLANNPTLDRVRNLFYFACWTALRPSDFTKLNNANIEGDVLRIRPHKTSKNATKKEDLLLPIHFNLQKIIDKAGGIPQLVSSQHMNKHLPTIGKLIGMTDKFTIIRQNSEGKQTQLQFARYEKLKCCCARKTFATNREALGLSIQEAMHYTAHGTESAFLHYVMEDEEARIETIREKLNKVGTPENSTIHSQEK
jgi:integrase